MLRGTIIFIVFIYSLSSCTPVIKMIYGIKKPKPKTNEQVVEYYKKVFDKEYEIYRPSDSISFAELRNIKLNSAPNIIFFDGMGNQKSIHADTMKTCTVNAENFIKQLSLLEHAPQMELSKLDVMEHLTKINFKEVEIEKTKYKNSILIFWADWAGPKLNKEATQDWLRVYDELDQQTKSNIDLKIVNLDMLPSQN